MKQQNGSICSYLAYPKPGNEHELLNELEQIKGCEVHPDSKHEIMIVVTEAENEKEDKLLREEIEKVESLQCLAMVFGSEVNY